MKNVIKFIIKHIFLFLIGGGSYVGLELLWRGYSHWTMFFLGGLCFVLVGLLNEIFTWDDSLINQGIIGSYIITNLEYVTGYIVNIKLGWNVWDYSDVPFNIQGQICLPFMLLWILVSIIAIILDDYIRYWFFNEEKPHYKIW